MLALLSINLFDGGDLDLYEAVMLGLKLHFSITFDDISTRLNSLSYSKNSFCFNWRSTKGIFLKSPFAVAEEMALE